LEDLAEELAKNCNLSEFDAIFINVIKNFPRIRDDLSTLSIWFTFRNTLIANLTPAQVTEPNMNNNNLF